MSAILTLRASAVLFDMDGVLVDSRAVVERVWRQWAAANGHDADAIIRVAHGRRVRDTLAMLAPELDPVAEVARLDAAESTDFDGVVAVPGAPALVSSIPRDRWAIVTSAGAQLALRRLRAAHVPVPDRIVSADLLVRGKPDPEGYLKGAEALGVSPGECLVFEDAPPGVEAALRAGMRVVGVATTYEPGDLVGPIRVVDDLTTVSVHVDADGLQVSIG